MEQAGLHPGRTPRGPRALFCTHVWWEAASPGAGRGVKQVRPERSHVDFQPGAGLLRNKKTHMCLLIFIREPETNVTVTCMA